MKPRIVMLGGPNLDRLGSRQPDIYGTVSWSELADRCRQWADEAGLDLDFVQTDVEGELVRQIHAAGAAAAGLILNAAAYTHTSVAVRDAVAAVSIPVVELHLTNPDARESLRRRNFLADVVEAGIRGFGTEGYRLALQGMAALLKDGD